MSCSLPTGALDVSEVAAVADGIEGKAEVAKAEVLAVEAALAVPVAAEDFNPNRSLEFMSE